MSDGTVTAEQATERIIDVTYIRDDAECIRILTEAGLLDQAKVTPPYNTANLVFNHAGHHCLCFYREGFIHGGDNGYEILMIPHGSCSPEDVSSFFSAVIQTDTLCGLLSMGMGIGAYAREDATHES